MTLPTARKARSLKSRMRSSSRRAPPPSPPGIASMSGAISTLVALAAQGRLHEAQSCGIPSRQMQAKAAASNVAAVAPPAPVTLTALELRLVRLPRLEPFEVSFGRMESRLLFLVRLEAESKFGWGECVAWESPLYSYETVGTARHVIRDYLAPAILGREITD